MERLTGGDRLCCLLFEEISAAMRSNLPPEEKVRIRIRRANDGMRITIRTKAQSDFIEEDPSPSSDEDDEIEQRIRSSLLFSNADRISTRFNRKNGHLAIVINTGKNPGRNREDELESFYSGHAGNPPSAWSQIRFLIGQRKAAFFFSLLIKAGRSLPMIVIPIISANIIDIVTAGSIADNMRIFVINIAAGVLSLLLHALFAYLDAVFFRELCRSMGAALRNVMVRKLQLLSTSFHNESHTGAIASKVLNSVDAIEESVRIMATQIATIGSYCTAAIVVTLINCPIMSLFYVLFIPLAIVISAAFRKPVRVKNLEMRKAMEDTTSAVTEMLDMVEITKAHGLQDKEVSRIERHVESIRDSGRELDITNEFLGSISWIILQLFQLFALAFSASLAGRGIISIGMIALFQAYFTATVTRLSTFINILPQVTKGFDACVSIAEILCIDNDEHRGTRIPHSFEGAVRFCNVSFSYGKNEVPVLKDFCLDIPARSSIAVVGGSGSGKSTVLRLILGFILPDSGTVEIDGISTNDINLNAFRKHIAVVPQQTMLFSGTLYQNLVYGAPSYVSRSHVMEVIRQVGLGSFINSLPQGLESPVAESASNLSGGQLQRLSIARALLRNPSIILLDEPTSALDQENEQRIMDILKKISGTCTIIMVAHRLNTIKNFDSIAVLRNGTLAEHDSYDNLMKKDSLFRQMQETQNE